ncbi:MULTISPECIES: hypothetical protein [Bacillales]|uniref:Uncharacterized protein n=1 Tax=Lacicoccus qingdaonensis TaxID=576118 RepID=A0A1G9JDT5_9BACL|nr:MULTISPECIES: hypothetical protein [Salinicoccus]SDL35376.1 hypothetical protein SAMN05216216_1487 [Salinicoccus qingdaonensis]
MLGIFKLLMTITIFTVMLLFVNKSALFANSNYNQKNSTASIFLKQLIGLEIIILVILIILILWGM